jgi:EAL domain-containing protein (putative c-di-GMP-specific phosphodiesterase class I)
VEVFDPDRDHLPGEPGPDGLGNVIYEIARGRLLRPVYQPIVDLRSGRVVGFEGLVRPDPDGPIPDSERLFGTAAATGRTVELDLASFETVAAGARDIGPDHVISINLSAKTLEVRDFDSGWLLNTLVRHGISPARVIVELTERDPIVDLERLKNNVRHLAEYGLRLAADDVGAGSAGLRLLAEVPFDVVKIDLSLVQSGDQHAASWEVLRSIRDFAWRQQTVVIGEGVETPEQLKALQRLAIPIGQGYLLGRPQARPDTRPRDLTRLALEPRAVPTGAPHADDQMRERLAPPELVIEQPAPRPTPRQLGSLPTSQLGATT